jgi:hypothetical protein
MHPRRIQIISNKHVNVSPSRLPELWTPVKKDLFCLSCESQFIPSCTVLWRLGLPPEVSRTLLITGISLSHWTGRILESQRFNGPWHSGSPHSLLTEMPKKPFRNGCYQTLYSFIRQMECNNTNIGIQKFKCPVSLCFRPQSQTRSRPLTV